MNPSLIGTIIIFILFVGILTGHPIAFVVGGTAMVAALFFWGPHSIYSMLSMSFGVIDNFVLLAIPLFVFMAMVLDRAAVAQDMYSSIYKWSGPLRGGLAAGTVVACTIFAACTGIAAAGVVTMGVVALPQMLKHRYEKGIAMGCVMAGGTLGQLIPPSVLIILYGAVARVSIGQMFAGGLAAGLVLSCLFIAYILIKSYIQKDFCPALLPEERVNIRGKIVSLRTLVLPVLLIVAVLGSIFSGAATPTEASAVGAIGALIASIVLRRFNWKLLDGSVMASMKLCGMIGWMLVASACFSSGFIGSGGGKLVSTTLLVLGGGGKWATLIATVGILFILGMLIDPTVMVLVGAPLFTPVIEALGFDMLWFGLLFMIMLQIGYISPPFGYSLFFMKGVAPEGTTMSDIYKSVIPFVGLQLIGLVIFIVFPESMLWLPHLLFR